MEQISYGYIGSLIASIPSGLVFANGYQFIPVGEGTYARFKSGQYLYAVMQDIAGLESIKGFAGFSQATPQPTAYFKGGGASTNGYMSAGASGWNQSMLVRNGVTNAFSGVTNSSGGVGVAQGGWSAIGSPVRQDAQKYTHPQVTANNCPNFTADYGPVFTSTKWGVVKSLPPYYSMGGFSTDFLCGHISQVSFLCWIDENTALVGMDEWQSFSSGNSPGSGPANRVQTFGLTTLAAYDFTQGTYTVITTGPMAYVDYGGNFTAFLPDISAYFKTPNFGNGNYQYAHCYTADAIGGGISWCDSLGRNGSYGLADSTRDAVNWATYADAWNIGAGSLQPPPYYLPIPFGWVPCGAGAYPTCYGGVTFANADNNGLLLVPVPVPNNVSDPSRGTTVPYALENGSQKSLLFKRFPRGPASGYVGDTNFTLIGGIPMGGKLVYVVRDNQAPAGVYDLYYPSNPHYGLISKGIRNFARPITPTTGDIK